MSRTKGTESNGIRKPKFGEFVALLRTLPQVQAAQEELLGSAPSVEQDYVQSIGSLSIALGAEGGSGNGPESHKS
jgi:hypothetical protein